MLNEVVIDRGMKPQLCNLQVCLSGLHRLPEWGRCVAGAVRPIFLPRRFRLASSCSLFGGLACPTLYWLGCFYCCMWVFCGSSLPLLSSLQCYVDQNHVTVVQGDGLIVATPTGATTVG